MRKIGIFGGTFDPVHNAHIAIANAAQKQLGLDFVIMMTGGNPPHKRGKKILDAKIRHIMLKLAIKDEKHLIASDWEVKRKEYSYTVNTLEFFRTLYPDDMIYFIIGGDSLRDFDTWYMPEKICSLCTLAVYERGESPDFEHVRRRYNAQIVAVEGSFLDISSTMLRQDYDLLLKNTPPAVSAFIKKYGLYRNLGTDMEILKKLLTPQRLAHSIGVAELSRELAGIYGVNADTAYRAGLLHDCAKCIAPDEALVMCDELEAELDQFERAMPPLIHPKLGAELAKCLFGINEGEITSAIRWHTVGRVGMTLLDKIVFVADMCEAGRDFPGVEDIRCQARKNINRAAVMCIDSTVRFNEKKSNAIHPSTALVRADLEKEI